MATGRDNETSSFDIKNLLNVVVNKIESYEHKIDNIETKVSELSVIKHQIDSFQKQVSEILTDIKSLREDFQDLKSVEYRVEDLVKWKGKIEQVLTVNDLSVLKTKSVSQEILLTQLTDRLLTIKEEIKKENRGHSLTAGAGAGSLIVALVQALTYFTSHTK